VLTYLYEPFSPNQPRARFQHSNRQSIGSQVLLKASLWSERGWNRVCECASVLGRFRQEALSTDSPNGVLRLPMQQMRTFKNCWLLAPFTRNDGTAASVGEYLVNRRFFTSASQLADYKAQAGRALRIRRAETFHPPGRGSGNAITTWVTDKGSPGGG